MYYGIATVGPFPGPTVFATAAEAVAHVVAVEKDSMGDQESYYADPHAIACVRVNEYTSREAAARADLSDTTDDLHERFTPGFVRTVWVRATGG